MANYAGVDWAADKPDVLPIRPLDRDQHHLGQRAMNASEIGLARSLNSPIGPTTGSRPMPGSGPGPVFEPNASRRPRQATHMSTPGPMRSQRGNEEQKLGAGVTRSCDAPSRWVSARFTRGRTIASWLFGSFVAGPCEWRSNRSQSPGQRDRVPRGGITTSVGLGCVIALVESYDSWRGLGFCPRAIAAVAMSCGVASRTCRTEARKLTPDQLAHTRTARASTRSRMLRRAAGALDEPVGGEVPGDG